MWTFIQDHILGIKWLNGLTGNFLSILGLDTGTKTGASIVIEVYV